MNIKFIFRRVIRLTPAFAVAAFTASVVANLVGTPKNQVATVVAVPLMVFFLISRIAVLLLPRTSPSDEEKTTLETMPLSAEIAVPIFLMSGVASLVAILSSGVYKSVGLAGTSVHALQFSCVAFAVTLLAFVSLVGIARGNSEPAVPVRQVAQRETALAWKLMRCPGVLAMLVFGHYGSFYH